MSAVDRWLVKFEAREPERFDAGAHVPVFHRWIQQKRLPLVLIDVADYEHVPNGPGVLLVSHEYNIFADRFDGRPGLTVQRKVRGGAGAPALLDTLRIALEAVRVLEGEASLPGSRFRVDAVEVVANDRLRAPDTDEGWETVSPSVREAARALYGDAAGVERWMAGPGRRLSARVTGGSGDAASLLARLGA